MNERREDSKCTAVCMKKGLIQEIEAKERYREQIISIITQINDEKFLRQILTILKRHMRKRGD